MLLHRLLLALMVCLLTACQEAQPLPGTPAAVTAAVRLVLHGRHGMGHGGYGGNKTTALSYLLGALAKNLPVTCGHRGAAGYAPENTLPSFSLALAQGCHMYECDVRLSADQQLIVIHESGLEHTTNGHGSCHAHAYAGDLDQLDAGAWFSQAFAHTRVPTLRDTLLWSKDKPIIPLLHLKEPGLVQPLTSLLAELRLADKVVVHSELLDELDRFKDASPDTATLPLWFDRPATPGLAAQLAYLQAHHHNGVALPYDLKDPALMEGLQAKGYLVELFTLEKDPLENARTMAKAATIFTGDYPDLLLSALSAS